MAQCATMVALFDVWGWMFALCIDPAFPTISFIRFQSSSKASAVCLGVAKIQRIYNLIRWREGLSGRTWFNWYSFLNISRFTEVSAPSCYLHYEQMCQEPETLIQRRMTNGYILQKVKGQIVRLVRSRHVWHRCMKTVPMCLDWKVTANPLTRLTLPRGAAGPATKNREPSVARYPPQTIWSQRSCTLCSIHLHSAFPSNNQPPETHQSQSPVGGST